MSKKNPSILFFYPHPAKDTLKEVNEGRAPSERMYGLVELRKRGWTVNFCDARFEGPLAGLIGRFEKFGVRLINWGVIRAIRSHDIVVVKDSFSTLITLVARLLGKKLIYLDSMFAVPKRRWRWFATLLNLRLATATLCYSETQRRLWIREFKLPDSRLIAIPYGIDTAFYQPCAPTARPPHPYVLSVGRDMGRDFTTLMRALESGDINLKLVTMSYLLPAGAKEQNWINIAERISYAQMFELYAGACAVIVPLHAGITYPSGIRAALESLAMGAPTVITRTEILEEYIRVDENTMFVDAEDAVQLRQAIDIALANWESGRSVNRSKVDDLRRQYGMDTFVDAFESVLRSISSNRHV